MAGQTPTLTIEVEDDKQGGLRIKTVTKNGDVLTTDAEAVFTALFTNKYVAEPTYYQPHVKKLMTNISRPLPVKVTVPFTMTITNNPGNGAAPVTPADMTQTIELPSKTTWATYTYETKDFSEIKFTRAGTYEFEIKEGQWTSEPTLADGTFVKKPATDAKIQVVVEDDKQGKLFVKDVKILGGETTATTGNDFTYVAQFTNEYIPKPTEYQAHVKKLMTNISRPLPIEVTVPFTMAIEKNPDNGAAPKNAAAMTQNIVLPSATTWATYNYETKDFSVINLTWANEYEFSIKEGQWTSNPTLAADTFVKKPATDATLKIKVEDQNGQLVVVSATATGETTTVGGSAENYTYTAQFTNEYIPKPTEYQPRVKKLMTNISRPLPIEVTVPFTMAIEKNPDNGAAPKNAAAMTQNIVLPSATTWATYNYETKDFSVINLTWANEYEFSIKEGQWTSNPTLAADTFVKKPATDATLKIKVEDQNGQLVVVSATATGETTTVGGSAENYTYTAQFTNEYIPKPTEYRPRVKKLMTNISRPLPVEVTVPFTMTITANPDTGAAIRTPADATQKIVLPSATTWATYTYETKDFSFVDLTWANTYELKITEDQWTSNPTLVDGTFVKKPATDAKITIEVVDNNGQLEVKTVTQTAGETVTIGADNVFTAQFTNEYIPKPTEYQPHVKKLMTNISRPLPVEVTVPFTMTITANPDTGAAIRTPAEATQKIVLPSATTWATYTYETKDFSVIDLTWANTYAFKFTEDQWTSTPKLADGTFYKKDAPDAAITVEVIDNYGQLEVKKVTQTAGETVTIGADNVFTAEFTNEYIPKPTKYQPHVKKLMTEISRPLPVDVTVPFTMEITDNPDSGAEIRTPAEATQTIVLPKDTPMENYESETKDFSWIDLTWANTYGFSFTEGEHTSDPALAAGTFYKKDAPDAAIEVEVFDNYGQLEVKNVTVTAGETTETTGTDFTYVAQFTNEYIPEPTDHPINGEKIVDGDTQKDMEFTFKLTPISAVLTNATTVIEVPMPAVDTVTTVGPEPFTFGDVHYEWAGVYTYEINETIGNYVGYTFDGRIWTVTVTVTDENGKLTAKSEYEADDKSVAKLAQFKNIFETSTLTVTKTVTTTVVNGDTLYEFTVELFDENGDPLYGVYPITGSVKGNVVNGKATFSLAHNQNAVISDIPIGASYKVTEKLDKETYTTTFVNADGTIEREGNISNWYNKPKSVVPNLGGLWINVGDCFE